MIYKSAKYLILELLSEFPKGLTKNEILEVRKQKGLRRIPYDIPQYLAELIREGKIEAIKIEETGFPQKRYKITTEGMEMIT
ncbi:MAG: hypothetical protein PVF58_14235 [Candidatus Methanofastidiosia archaeon]|jgi:hypothetical protein